MSDAGRADECAGAFSPSGDIDTPEGQGTWTSIGCGIGLLMVQLALNGATHVCAIDLEKHTVVNALASAFRNGVVDRRTTLSADLYPWVAEQR